MKEYITFLRVANAEIQTIIDYATMLEESDEEREAAPILHELIGDEFNHAIISILKAARLMDITIPHDGIEEAGDEAEIEALAEKEEEEKAKNKKAP